MSRRVRPLTDWDWYAFLVNPQKEFITARILRGPKFRFATLVPQQQRFRRTTRRQRRRVKFSYALMPRYVFVGMNDQTAGWAQILPLRPIRGVITVCGLPARIPPDALEDLESRSAAGAFSAPNYAAYQRGGREVGPGDFAELLDGPLEGYHAKIIDIEDDEAQIAVEMLGGERRIRVALEMLGRPAF